MDCIDFHTHAFPDALARRAVASLEENGGIEAHSDGSVGGLLASMDRAGIGQAVLCSIATRPGQFEDILHWSTAIRSERIVPLPSVHPRDPQWLERVRTVHAQGFVGIKMHSYYQDFDLDEPALFPLYDELSVLGLVLVVHTGFDIAFPRQRRADAARTVALAARWPRLKLVATHLGGWDDWDEAERLLIGRPIHLELSLGLHALPPEHLRRLLLAHPQDYLLFGSDSPWSDQAASLAILRALRLPPALFDRITGGNARRLLAGR